jgi:hypothetical protein
MNIRIATFLPRVRISLEYALNKQEVFSFLSDIVSPFDSRFVHVFCRLLF